MELSPEDVLIDDETGAPRVRPQDTVVAWVVVLYNPSCMMSRAVAPLIELAAARSVETRFAAFACGGHGSEKVEFEAAAVSNRLLLRLFICLVGSRAWGSWLEWTFFHFRACAHLEAQLVAREVGLHGVLPAGRVRPKSLMKP